MRPSRNGRRNAKFSRLFRKHWTARRRPELATLDINACENGFFHDPHRLAELARSARSTICATIGTLAPGNSVTDAPGSGYNINNPPRRAAPKHPS
jgi:hypothetical protein